MLQKSRTGCQVMPVWSLITAIISIAKITMITLITSILLVSLFATLFAALFLPLFDTLVLTQSASFWALLVTLASSWPTASTSPVTHWITAYSNVHDTHMHNIEACFCNNSSYTREECTIWFTSKLKLLNLKHNSWSTVCLTFSMDTSPTDIFPF